MTITQSGTLVIWFQSMISVSIKRFIQQAFTHKCMKQKKHKLSTFKLIFIKHIQT